MCDFASDGTGSAACSIRFIATRCCAGAIVCSWRSPEVRTRSRCCDCCVSSKLAETSSSPASHTSITACAPRPRATSSSVERSQRSWDHVLFRSARMCDRGLRAWGRPSKTPGGRCAMSSSTGLRPSSARMSSRRGIRVTIRRKRFCCVSSAALAREDFPGFIHARAVSSGHCWTFAGTSFVAYLFELGQGFCEDESNRDLNIPRNQDQARTLAASGPRFFASHYRCPRARSVPRTGG